MRPSWTARPRSFCRSNALLCRRGTQGGKHAWSIAALHRGRARCVHRGRALVAPRSRVRVAGQRALAVARRRHLGGPPYRTGRAPALATSVLGGLGTALSSSAARRGARRWRSCSTERSPPHHHRAPRRQGPGLARPTLTSNRGPEERFLSWGRRGDRSDGGPAAIRAWRPRGGLFADSAYAHGVVYANGSEWDFANPRSRARWWPSPATPRRSCGNSRCPTPRTSAASRWRTASCTSSRPTAICTRSTWTPARSSRPCPSARKRADPRWPTAVSSRASEIRSRTFSAAVRRRGGGPGSVVALGL